VTSDLLAIATVRRLLLELGYAVQPEEGRARVGPISVWVAMPRAELDGRSPLQALASPGGEERVRACLRDMLAARREPPK